MFLIFKNIFSLAKINVLKKIISLHQKNVLKFFKNILAEPKKILISDFFKNFFCFKNFFRVVAGGLRIFSLTQNQGHPRPSEKKFL